MSTQKRAFFSTLTGRVLGSLVALIGLLALMYFTAPPSEPNVVIDLPPDQVVPTDVRSDKELDRIIEGLRPGRLGISSDREEMVSQLNNWSSKFVNDEDVAALVKDQALLNKLLSGETLKRVETDLYLPEDASHVRESLLVRSIVEHVTADVKTDAARTVALFEYVSRYISILPDEASESMALTPYESLLFGVGTAADRAWVFSSLLRQLRLDSFIVRPKNEQKQNLWLVGVNIPKSGVLLFDTRLGLPIPALEDEANTAFPEQPASLRQVRENDAVLRQFDVAKMPYPLVADDFKDVSIELIGTSSAWAPRMAELQFMLPVNVTVDLYDGLGENAIYQPGKLDRVISAGKDLWTADDISVWSHPDQQITRIESAHGVEGTELGNLLLVMAGPYINSIDNATGNVYQGTVKRSLHFVRVQQLQGENAEALKNLFPIRSAANQLQLPANVLANDYASIWTGMCQFEQGKYQPALNTFQRYVNSHNQGEGQSRVAFEWAALCYLKVGAEKENFLKAAELIANAPRGYSGQRDAFLVRRWLKLGGVDVEKSPRQPEPTPQADPKPVPETTPSEPVTEKPEDKSKPQDEVKPEDSAQKPEAEEDKPETTVPENSERV